MKKIQLIIASLIIALTFVLSSTVCFAGSMNSYESSVYATASGTFTYEGNTYRAAPGYLAQLQAYLCRDDINLTESQARQAIAQINSRVGEGVAKGYILPVGNTSKPTDDSNKDPLFDDNVKDEIDSSNSNSQGVSSNGEMYNSLTENQEKIIEKTLSNRPDENEAESSMIYDLDNDSITVTKGDGSEMNLPNDISTEYYSGAVNIVYTVAIISLIGTLLCVILLLAFGTFRFQKNKKSSHKTRKRVRKITGLILLLVLAIDVAALGASSAMHIGYFNNTKISNSLSDSGYYHDSYNDMISSVHNELKAAGCMENLCDDTLTYENFIFATKNQLQLSLKGGSSSATYEDVKDSVIDAVDGIDYFTDESKEELGQKVLDIYKKHVYNIVGKSAYSIKTVYSKATTIPMILFAISAVLVILTNLLCGRFIHKGLRSISRGLMLSGVMVLAIAGYISLASPFKELYIKPDYLYVFLNDYVSNGAGTFIATGVVIMVTGLLLRIVASLLRKQKKNS